MGSGERVGSSAGQHRGQKPHSTSSMTTGLSVAVLSVHCIVAQPLLLSCQRLLAGLSREAEEQSFELEASQGDRIVGIISRPEVAAVVAAALDSPASSGTPSGAALDRTVHIQTLMWCHVPSIALLHVE